MSANSELTELQQQIEQIDSQLKGRSLEEKLKTPPPKKLLDRIDEWDVSERGEIVSDIHRLDPPDMEWRILAYFSQWDQDWTIRKGCIEALQTLWMRFSQPSVNDYVTILEISALSDAHGEVRDAAIEQLKTAHKPTLGEPPVQVRIASVLNRVGLLDSSRETRELARSS